VHHDLYTWTDPAEERRRRHREARQLGMLLVLFVALVSGVVVVKAGPWSSTPRLALDPAAFPPETRITSPSLFSFEAPSGERVQATRAVHPDEEAPAQAPGEQAVLLMAGDREVATLYAPGQAPAVGAQLRTPSASSGVDLTLSSGWRHTWDHGALFGLIPWKGFVLVGGSLAVVCWLPVLGPVLYRAWMLGVAAPLGWFNARVILTILFLLAFVPGGLFLRLRRRKDPAHDPLGRGSAGGSYWRTRPGRDLKHFRKWF
jgi:hypothetical protein